MLKYTMLHIITIIIIICSSSGSSSSSSSSIATIVATIVTGVVKLTGRSRSQTTEDSYEIYRNVLNNLILKNK